MRQRLLMLASSVSLGGVAVWSMHQVGGAELDHESSKSRTGRTGPTVDNRVRPDVSELCFAVESVLLLESFRTHNELTSCVLGLSRLCLSVGRRWAWRP